MTRRHPPPGGTFSCRVLGLVLSQRFGGEVVVDGFGIAPVPRTPEETRDANRQTSFRSMNFREVRDGPLRRRFIERHLARAVRKHRPTLAVLGVPEHQSDACHTPCQLAKQFLERRGIPVIERSISQARRLLLGQVRGRKRDVLPQTLIRSFFPELTHHPRETLQGRYERHAWNALAVAVITLAERNPVSVFALMQPRADLPPAFSNFLSRTAFEL